jgi:hypothetical protein
MVAVASDGDVAHHLADRCCGFSREFRVGMRRAIRAEDGLAGEADKASMGRRRERRRRGPP